MINFFINTVIVSLLSQSHFVQEGTSLKEVNAFNGTTLQFSDDFFNMRSDEQISIIDFPLSKNEKVDLTLEAFDVFTSDAEVVIGKLDKDKTVINQNIERPNITLLKGAVERYPDSTVFFAIGEHGTNGWIELDDEVHIIATHPKDKWTAIYNQNEIDPDLMNWVDVKCAANELEHNHFAYGESSRGGDIGDSDQCPAIRVGIETDWEFTNLFGGNTNASGEYAATLMGAVSTIFEQDISVELTISYLRLWDTSDDLWSGGGAGDQLYEFRDYWNANMDFVSRHLAHFLSGANLGGGVAWVGAVCTNYGYAVSGNLGGYFPLPIEDHSGNNWDLMVVAHETGHNCGTGHTHDYSPPIDGCGIGDCSNAYGGTIMSYCHTCSGGMSNVVMNFHPLVQDTMSNYIDGLSCSLGGDGSPPSVGIDNVWAMDNQPVDIDVLSNDYPNDCSEILYLDSFDNESLLGGTVEMIGDDPSTAILRYTPTGVENNLDAFNYVVVDGSGQSAEGGVLINLSFPRQPDNPSAVEPGVKTRYYALNDPTVLPDFDLLDPISEEIVENVDYPSTNGNFAGSGLSENVGAVFEGFVSVEQDDLYTLYVNSDDGSRIFVGDQLLVDNDGLHAMNEESGQILLAAGLHAIKIEFFERGGGAGCIASISSESMAKQVMTPEMLSHEVAVYGDINGDGLVNVEDLLIAISEWGPCSGECLADIDGSDTVDIADLLEIIANWTV